MIRHLKPEIRLSFLPVLSIIWEVIAPIFAMVGLGYLVQKRVGLDLPTLTRLNFYIFVPAFLFVNIYESKLSLDQLSRIGLHFILFFSIIAVLAWSVASLFGLGERMKRALTASVIFYNSGNYGIPVAQLAFGGATLPLQVQAAMVMLQNITTFTVGVFLMAGGRGGRKRDTLLEVFKLPMIYVLALAGVMRTFGWAPLPPINTALHFLSGALVPVAVVTLGAQMAGLEVPRFGRALSLSLALRLVASPIIGFGLVWALGIKGLLGEALMVSTSFPTAVNSALLALQFENEPEFAAAAVFYSTLVSTLTVSATIYVARVWLFEQG